MKRVYLGGGCFWGIEAYFSKVKGVVATEVGYLNGHVINPTYEQVCSGNTGALEAVQVDFDENITSLKNIVRHLFKNIDPTTKNRQGNDIGTQYRTGVYYVAPKDRKEIEEVFLEAEKNYKAPMVIELALAESYYRAEEYHQKYLEKNPRGYCHNAHAIFELAQTKDYIENSDE